jgi:uncharacterized protein YjbI with pentapeptide repeats
MVSEQQTVPAQTDTQNSRAKNPPARTTQNAPAQSASPQGTSSPAPSSQPPTTESPAHNPPPLEAATWRAENSSTDKSSPQNSHGDELRGISLLDLAEVLDQHKIWVESGGESGTKADLCGVNLDHADLTGVNLQGAFLNKANLRGADLSLGNLRGASLVQADMRDTNLLGTELRGANLMGATLYGAEGLWVGRLGGTNLFDAMLPEAVATFDGSKAIAQATRFARWIYSLILASCAVCALVVAFTTDARLVMNSSAIPFGRAANALPLSGFYLGAPIFIVLFYLRFHFLLLRLWSNMAALPAVFIDGNTPEKDGPWFLMALVRRHFRWMREVRAPQSILETVVATILAYWVAPATLFFFWLRYLARQDMRGTLLHVLLIALSVAAASCLPTIVSRVLRPGDLYRKSKAMLPVVLSTLKVTLLAGVVLIALSFGVIRGLPADKSIAPEISTSDFHRWAAQALQLVGYRPYADVTESSFSPLPAHGDWSDQGLAAIRGIHLNQMSLRYARAYHTFWVNARLWRANLEGVYLSESDLRGANLREARLHDAVLDRVQAGHAIFVSADARAINLSGADLRAADLSYGIFEGATLSNAKLNGASMYAINLRDAQLLRTDLSRADVRDAKLERAALSLANLQDADFSAAKLVQANLTGAQLHGAIFLDTQFKNADLRGALLTGAVVREAHLDGVNVEGADLRGAIGLTVDQVCSTINWRAALLDNEIFAAAQSRCASASAKP